MVGLVTAVPMCCRLVLNRGCGASGSPWAHHSRGPTVPGTAGPPAARRGGIQANITWDRASSGEVLSEKKLQLASVSKSTLTLGLAARSGRALPWAGESSAWGGCGQGLHLGMEEAVKQNCSIWRCPQELEVKEKGILASAYRRQKGEGGRQP